MLLSITADEALAQLDSFDAVIDARSPAEHALDALPGALNWPSLSDQERHEVGTEYKQASAFMAKKRGAALVARNIAQHVERHVLDKPRSWHPLVYCWRGGTRSGALCQVLDQIGFRVHRLDGGYQAYRRAVVQALAQRPAALALRVVVATTGSGKTRLLQVLRDQGAQVLDLEALANHRGSVLGLEPGQRQPTQKAFETRLWDTLRRLDPARPVYVESESQKVGDLRVPPELVAAMRAAPCVVLELPMAARIELLRSDYPWFVSDVEAWCARLHALRPQRGHAVIEAWQAQARAGRTSEVVQELLQSHYDPIYRESLRRHYPRSAQPLVCLAWDGSAHALAQVAARILAAG